jgi:hypothetical protein
MVKVHSENEFWKYLICLLSCHCLTVLYQLHCLTVVNYIPWFLWLHFLPSLVWLNNGSNCGMHCCTDIGLTHMRMVWLPVLTLNGPMFTGESFVSTSEILMSTILEWFEWQD